MEDERIIELYWERSENAIRETEAKYGKYLLTTSKNILETDEDCMECLNDTLLSAWNSIPPARPQMLRTFLAKIMRNTALKKWRDQRAQKRGSGKVAEAIDEMDEISDNGSFAEDAVNSMVLSQILEDFLKTLEKRERALFIKRYWLFMTTREIAQQTGLGESNVRVVLHRMRGELKELLKKAGFDI